MKTCRKKMSNILVIKMGLETNLKLTYKVGDRIRVNFSPGSIVTVRAIRMVNGKPWIDIEEITLSGISSELVTEVIPD